ncbi:MAG: alcohol dehydrogenase catalytic domain-containing protein [Thaumarchaeota archaeon]|nr:alcohol dehydrogenase catalytic domain-containing protein [Nitrososphaerota archaeon]
MLHDGDVLVEMRACGLCGTDIEKLKGEYTAAMPVLGHEAVGVVARLGPRVKGFHVGDRVFPHHHVPCGRCGYCLRGSLTMCDDYRKSNLSPGGFSEFFKVPGRNVLKGGVLALPPGLSFQEAALIEPVACCLRAIDRCGAKRGDSVLVAGAGPAGMAHALLLRSMGAKVMISDVSEWRLSFARRLGFRHALDAKSEVEESVMRETEERGADVVIVASGSPNAVVQGMRSVRKGGTVCLFGIPVEGSSLEYSLSAVYNREVSIIPSYGATEADTRRALKIVASGRINFRSLITGRYTLDRFDQAVEAASGGGQMKVIVLP